MGVVEDVHHFMMVCPMHAHRRAKLLKVASAALARAEGITGGELQSLPSVEQMRILLGGRVGDPVAEDRVDGMAKRYLRKAWNARSY